MHNPQITIIINAHREGLLVGPTLRSITEAINHAALQGIQTEVLSVLDRSDEITREMFLAWSSKDERIETTFVELGDLGLSRNHGVKTAKGKWIAFLDADDLWSNNWLSSAYKCAEAETRRCVWHPETNLFFGARPHVFNHVDMDSLEFDISALAETNIWTALCFAERQVLIDIPYNFTDHRRQIGYEDWNWNMKTIENGIIHKIVPGTSHAIRTKTVSLVSQTNASACLPYPTNLFRNIISKRSSVKGSM